MVGRDDSLRYNPARGIARRNIINPPLEPATPRELLSQGERVSILLSVWHAHVRARDMRNICPGQIAFTRAICYRNDRRANPALVSARKNLDLHSLTRRDPLDALEMVSQIG